jgi:hypothetical protein
MMPGLVPVADEAPGEGGSAVAAAPRTGWRTLRLASRPAAVLGLLLVVACGDPTVDRRPVIAGGMRLSGLILEKLDAPPYSFLRIQTRGGEAWVAVPVVALPPRTHVTVIHGAELRNFTATQLQRRFDSVVFGTLDARR